MNLKEDDMMSKKNFRVITGLIWLVLLLVGWLLLHISWWGYLLMIIWIGFAHMWLNRLLDDQVTGFAWLFVIVDVVLLLVAML